MLPNLLFHFSECLTFLVLMQITSSSEMFFLGLFITFSYDWMFLNGSKLQIHDRTNFIFWVCRFACFAWFSYSYHVSCWIMMNYWWRKFNKAAVLTPGVFFLLFPSQITKIKICLPDHRIARMWQMSVDWICWVVQNI